MDEGTQVVKAMALIRRSLDGALLVSDYTGPDAASFQRLLGGHVEFGEYAIETVRRELLDEIGQPLQDVELAGVIENHFTWKDRPQHEIVFVYHAAFADPAAYEIAEQRIRDDTGGCTRVVWRPASAVSPPLYPDGAAKLAATRRAGPT